jgi:hypothetical protein
VTSASIPPVLEDRGQALVAGDPVGDLVKDEQQARLLGQPFDQREGGWPARRRLRPNQRVVGDLGQGGTEQRQLLCRLAQLTAVVDGPL